MKRALNKKAPCANLASLGSDIHYYYMHPHYAIHASLQILTLRPTISWPYIFHDWQVENQRIRQNVTYIS